jgi:hypothetical protein
MPNLSLLRIREKGSRPSLRAPLALLLQATAFARRLGRSKWDFGVDGRFLKAAGLTLSQLHWLTEWNYVELAKIAPRRLNRKRADFPPAHTSWSGETRAVLTPKGEKAARRICATASKQGEVFPSATLSRLYSLAPTWNAVERRLSFEDLVVKTFLQPAANQELILAAFEEEGWPHGIDDPLPPRAGLSAKRRLHDAIKNLNRCQQHCLICFRGDGSGRRVVWDRRSVCSD